MMEERNGRKRILWFGELSRSIGVTDEQYRRIRVPDLYPEESTPSSDAEAMPPLAEQQMLNESQDAS